MLSEATKCPRCHVGLRLTFYTASATPPFTHHVLALLGGHRDEATVVAATSSEADAKTIAAALEPAYSDCALVVEAIDAQ